MAYIGPLVFIPLFINKDDKEIRYNTNQGLVLFLIEVVYEVIARILSTFLHMVLPILGNLASIIFTLGSLAFVLISIKAIINIVQERYEIQLPIIGDIQILK